MRWTLDRKKWQALLILPLTVAPLLGQDKPVFTVEDIAFFEATVRPVLQTNCAVCHNHDNPTSGLALDSRIGILAG